MKFKLLVTILVLLLTVSLQAQIDFGIGLQKELFSVSLNPENADDATFNVDKVDVSMLLSDHFRIGLGFQSGTLVNHEAKRYEPRAGLSLSLAYLFSFKNYKDFAIAPAISIGNSFKDFKSFQNYDVDVSVREYLFKSLFLGTGVRYAHWQNSDIVNNSNCLTWYWEMGFNLYFNKTLRK